MKVCQIGNQGYCDDEVIAGCDGCRFCVETESQQKIIDKACEWLSNHTIVDTDLFRKAMEEELCG